MLPVANGVTHVPAPLKYKFLSRINGCGTRPAVPLANVVAPTIIGSDAFFHNVPSNPKNCPDVGALLYKSTSCISSNS